MKTIFFKKLLLSVLILVLLIPHLTSAQISRVKYEVNKDLTTQIPSLIPQEKTNKKFSTFGKFVILSTTNLVVFGSMIAAFIGPQGGSIFCIGLLALPIINIELISVLDGVKRKSNKWLVKIGANTTFANYNKYNKRINIFFGVGRSYHKSGVFSFNWEVFYKSREFLLQNQPVYRPYPYYDIKYYDIDVSNSYIDIFLMPSVKLFDFSKSKINISFGLFLSAPVVENTKYIFKPLRKYTIDPNNVDFRVYPEDKEPDLFIDVFVGLSIGIEYELGKKIIQLKYCKACGSTDQIRRFMGKSRLNTLELMIGYKF